MAVVLVLVFLIAALLVARLLRRSLHAGLLRDLARQEAEADLALYRVDPAFAVEMGYEPPSAALGIGSFGAAVKRRHVELDRKQVEHQLLAEAQRHHAWKNPANHPALLGELASRLYHDFLETGMDCSEAERRVDLHIRRIVNLLPRQPRTFKAPVRFGTRW